MNDMNECLRRIDGTENIINIGMSLEGQVLDNLLDLSPQ